MRAGLVQAWIGLGLLLCPLGAMAASYPEQPVLVGGMACVSEGGVTCIDLSDPGRRWSALAGEHTLEPVGAGDAILVGGAAGLHVFAAADGEPRWHWRSGGMVFPPTVAGGVVYASDENGQLRALDLVSGETLWARRFDGWSYPPALVGGRLVTGGRGGVVRGLSPEDGRTLWRHALPQELVYRPVAAGPLAVVTTFGTRVLAFDRAGWLAWEARDPVPSFSPAVAGELLLFGGMDGRLRARRVATGEPVWVRRIGPGQLDQPVRPGTGTDPVALTSPAGEPLLLDPASGRVVQRMEAPGTPIGTPFRLPGGQWAVIVRRAGTISLFGLSQMQADD